MSGIAITFPSSAVEGQLYLAQNGFTYIYDSQKNRWKRGGEFVRAPKVLSYAGVAATTTGAGITTSPTGSLIYVIPGTVNPNSEVGVDSYKAYRASDSYPNYTEVQVSISSAFSSIAYAATFTGTTHTIPSPTLSGNTEYYLRARQFVGSNASAASTGAISGYSANPVKFTTASVFLDTPVIVSIAGTTSFPVYQVGFAGTTLPATVTYTGGGLGNLDKVEWRITGPRISSSTGDTALAEVGIGTHSSATLANSLVLAMPFSGASGVGITSDVNNAIRTASGASAGTTKTVTANGNAGIATIAGLALTSHFYNGAAYFDGNGDYLSVPTNNDFLFGSGNFTVECWFNSSRNNAYQYIASVWGVVGDNDNTYSSWLFRTANSGKLETVLNNGSSNSTITGNTTYATNSWNHAALVRNGNIVSIYLNGVLDVSSSYSSTLNSPSRDFVIGLQLSNNNQFLGYIQDLKIYKGLAKYTENFTPPLPTYGTISYTTGITNVGVATTAFFESTGDTPTAEVAIGSSTAAQVASSLVLAMPMNRTFGFQDINVAVRGLTSGASAGTAKGSVTTNTYRYWRLTQVLNFQSHTARASRYYLIQSNGTKTNIVTYAADNCADSGTILSNGDTITYDFGSATSVSGFGLYAVFSSSGYGSTFKLEGSADNTNWVFVSYGDILKETTGCSEIDAVLYTSRIPYISSSESKYYDGSCYFSGITTNFNNTLLPNYILIPQSSDFAFGTGNYTIEWWKYWNTISGYQTLYNMNYNLSNNLLIQTGNGDGKYRVFSNNASALLSETNAAASGRWYHYALVRSGTNLTIYRDGIANGSVTDSSDVGVSTIPLEIGRGGGKYPEQGYIQDLKIYKGFAKYTANFTPPQPICGFTTDISTQTGFTTTTATGALLSSVVGLGSTSTLAFSADQNLIGVTSITSSSGITTLPDPYAQNLVLALPLANITGVGNSFTNDRNTQIRSVSITGAGVTTGTTKTITNNSGVSTVAITTTTAYSNTAYFNGSNYLSALDNDLAFGTGDFTVECWIYAIAANDDGIYESRLSDGNATGFTLTAFSSTVIRTFSSGILISVTVEDYLNKWTHVSVSRRSNVSRIYVNGILRGSAVDNSNYTDNRAYIGSGVWGSSFFNGYIRDFKIYKGLGKYTTNFTPPPPMFGDYTRSTPNKLIFTPSSDYVLEARNTSGVTTSNYSATRQWGTKPKGGIYDPYGGNLVLAIPGGAVGGATTTFDVTGQIRYETPTATYVNAGIVTYSNSLGIGTYQNKTVTNNGPVSISSTITKYYSRSMQFNGSSYLDVSGALFDTPEWTFEAWIYKGASGTRDLLNIGGNICSWTFDDTQFTSCDGNGVGRGTVSVSHPGNNTWFHLAFVQLANGTDLIFINGIRNDRTINIPSGVLSLGNTRSDINAKWIGYIADVRYYNFAKYTSNFTPPNQIYLT